MKQIKRFLKSIAYEVVESKTTESIYYYISRNGKDYKIRLSSHFRSYWNGVNIDIVMSENNIMTIRTDNNYLETEFYDISYIKAFFLLLPNIYASCGNMSNVVELKTEELSKANKKYMKLFNNSDVKRVNDLTEKLAEKNQLIKELQDSIASKNKQIKYFTTKTNTIYCKHQHIIKELKKLQDENK